MADLAEGRGRLVDHQREGELTAAKRVDQIPLRGIDTRRLQDVRRKKKSLLQVAVRAVDRVKLPASDKTERLLTDIVFLHADADTEVPMDKVQNLHCVMPVNLCDERVGDF